MVCHEPTCTLVPGMSTLDNPALGLHDKALGNDLGPQRLLSILPGARAAVAGVTHDLDADAVGLLDGLGTFAAVGAIGVERLQPRNFAAGLRHDLGRRVAILHAGCSERDGQQQAQGVDHQMPLASFDLLARIEPRVAALGGAARALRVDDRRSRLRGSAHAVTPLLAQPVVQGLEHARCGPALERHVGCLPGREGLGQQTPRAPRAQRVAAGVDHVATLKAGRRTSLAIALKQVSHQGPLSIGQIRVHAAGAVAASVGAGIAIALQRRSLRCSALTRAAQRLESLDAGLAQGPAHGHRVDLDACAPKQLSRDFIQRRPRLLLNDPPKHRRVFSVQRTLAARPTGLLAHSALRHPSPRAGLPQYQNNARDIKFVYTLSENHPEPYAPSLPSYFVMAGSRNSVLPRLKPHPYFG
uniref:Uncharacterized protein n=1 Tax=mine drainage metagenome TaxID=410659 RepID=E6PQE4_9ZZZZ